MMIHDIFEYDRGIELGKDSDCEMRLHVDDDDGNVWIMGWHPEHESGALRRAPDYDGSLSTEQAEALRQWLNRRAEAAAIKRNMTETT